MTPACSPTSWPGLIAWVLEKSRSRVSVHTGPRCSARGLLQKRCRFRGLDLYLQRMSMLSKLPFMHTPSSRAISAACNFMPNVTDKDTEDEVRELVQ